MTDINREVLEAAKLVEESIKAIPAISIEDRVFKRRALEGIGHAIEHIEGLLARPKETK